MLQVFILEIEEVQDTTKTISTVNELNIVINELQAEKENKKMLKEK